MLNDICVKRLLESLQSQRLNDDMIEVKNLISNEKYRQAFLVMAKLKENGLWIPSDDDEKNLKKFWWDYAN
jgi:hypothetical protein